MTYIYIYTRTPTRLHYPARLRARVMIDVTSVLMVPVLVVRSVQGFLLGTSLEVELLVLFPRLAGLVELTVGKQLLVLRKTLWLFIVP